MNWARGPGKLLCGLVPGVGVLNICEHIYKIVK